MKLTALTLYLIIRIAVTHAALDPKKNLDEMKQGSIFTRAETARAPKEKAKTPSVPLAHFASSPTVSPLVSVAPVKKPPHTPIGTISPVPLVTATPTPISSFFTVAPMGKPPTQPATALTPPVGKPPTKSAPIASQAPIITMETARASSNLRSKQRSSLWSASPVCSSSTNPVSSNPTVDPSPGWSISPTTVSSLTPTNETPRTSSPSNQEPTLEPQTSSPQSFPSKPSPSKPSPLKPNPLSKPPTTQGLPSPQPQSQSKSKPKPQSASESPSSLKLTPSKPADPKPIPSKPDSRPTRRPLFCQPSKFKRRGEFAEEELFC